MAILEQETFEKYGYYPSELTPKSDKRILVACDDCGKIRIMIKYNYRALCHSCASGGEKNHMWRGGKVIQICKTCGNPFSVNPSVIKKGYGFFCSRKCLAKSRIGEKSPGWRGGELTRKCKICSKEFTVRPCIIKGGSG